MIMHASKQNMDANMTADNSRAYALSYINTQVPLRVATLATSVLVMAALVFAQAGVAHAFFSADADATGNTFTAGSLGFSLAGDTSVDEFQLYGATTTARVDVVRDGDSFAFSYEVDVQNINCGAGFEEDDLSISAVHGTENMATDVALADLYATSTSASSADDWVFDVELFSDSTTTHGAECEFDIVFHAWQTEFTDSADGGFTDTQSIHVDLTASAVVLNEVLPNPTGADTTDGENGEWVELYNNSDQTVDLTGWYIEEEGGVQRNIGVVEAGATTTENGVKQIDAHDWLVVFMNDDILNNDGDTVSLYDSSGNLRDQYAYGTSAGTQDPDSVTQGSANGTASPGSDASGTEGKSDARIPDGWGVWIDPKPTAGRPNEVSRSDLVAAGYDDATISAILAQQAEALSRWHEQERQEEQERREAELAEQQAEEDQQEATQETSDTSEEDTEAPVITLAGNNPAVVKLGNTYSDLGAHVTDNVNDNLGVSADASAVDAETPGTYTVSYTATDQAGNTARATRTVIVYDPEDGEPEAESLPKTSTEQQIEETAPNTEDADTDADSTDEEESTSDEEDTEPADENEAGTSSSGNEEEVNTDEVDDGKTEDDDTSASDNEQDGAKSTDPEEDAETPTVREEEEEDDDSDTNGETGSSDDDSSDEEEQIDDVTDETNEEDADEQTQDSDTDSEQTEETEDDTEATDEDAKTEQEEQEGERDESDSDGSENADADTDEQTGESEENETGNEENGTDEQKVDEEGAEEQNESDSGTDTSEPSDEQNEQTETDATDSEDVEGDGDDDGENI